ncbi:BRI1 kinase inhibitor 1-like [Cicer arietinum]|uniref:BRI1 kinase inhibitor 1-like n=1 Tax=Cicer arietinum TaxID=3827 RepID=A0A1S2Y458_CICAR|nr:BRI1 kinase inhibitor 1-like [Cicer arietinum]
MRKSTTFSFSKFPNNNKSKFSPPSFAALDLSPADEIFFHGHLLPLQILSHFPSSISPRSSTNSMDSFTLPIRELFSEEDENLPKQNSSSSSSNITLDSNNNSKREKNNNIGISKKVEGKFKFAFSLFNSTKEAKGSQIKEEKENHKKKKKLRFDVMHEVKKYLKKMKPFMYFKREKIRVHKKCYSYNSGNVTPRNKKLELKSWNWKGQYSAPASMRTSPSNSGVLFATTTPLPHASDSTMEELQGAIQAAITHCKNSFAKEENLQC